MGERVALVRPFTWDVIYPEVNVKSGSDTRSLSGPGDVTFSVGPEWHNRRAGDALPFFQERGTLVVVERANKTIRQVGLVDNLTLTESGLDVSCGGCSMIGCQFGRWEGDQGCFRGCGPGA